MKAVISVIGKDRPGILAFVSKECADRNINIEDVSQKVIQDLFTMIMIVETPDEIKDFQQVVKELESCGEEQQLKIHVMHADIFNAMHKV